MGFMWTFLAWFLLNSLTELAIVSLTSPRLIFRLVWKWMYTSMTRATVAGQHKSIDPSGRLQRRLQGSFEQQTRASVPGIISNFSRASFPEDNCF